MGSTPLPDKITGFFLLFYRNLTAAGEREAALPLRARFPQRPGEVGQWQKRTET